MTCSQIGENDLILQIVFMYPLQNPEKNVTGGSAVCISWPGRYPSHRITGNFLVCPSYNENRSQNKYLTNRVRMLKINGNTATMGKQIQHHSVESSYDTINGLAVVKRSTSRLISLLFLFWSPLDVKTLFCTTVSSRPPLTFWNQCTPLSY